MNVVLAVSIIEKYKVEFICEFRMLVLFFTRGLGVNLLPQLKGYELLEDLWIYLFFSTLVTSLTKRKNSEFELIKSFYFVP